MPNIYDQQKNQVKQRATAEGQAGNDAMLRRFTAMGGGANSGAFIKQSQIQNEALNKQQEDAVAGIDANQAHEKETQDFAQNQADQQRRFQSGEADKERAHQSGQFDQSLGFQKEQATVQNANKKRELDLQASQQELDKATTAFNVDMAKWQQKNSGGFFGSGGFLGLGF